MRYYLRQYYILYDRNLFSLRSSPTGYQILPPPANGGINEPQDCPHCRRTFSCYYSLKRHFQDKHERSDTLYVCEFCRRRYRTKNSLTTHKSLQHRGSAVALKRLVKTFAAAASSAAATVIATPTPPPPPPSSSSSSSESPPPKLRSRSPPLVVCNGCRSSSPSSSSSSAPSPSPPPAARHLPQTRYRRMT
ncbi:protein tramtrack, beta isoform-like [Melanaphis sacchari]|uniref:protein tramtrack, beta isoform-like n=1 Tax=Melanaphis sacchari TaxID=742174 RepID=UPI000DC12CC8|nr:protein tramtrack, beta isoform-like [Melanaphis sacchari]